MKLTIRETSARFLRRGIGVLILSRIPPVLITPENSNSEITSVNIWASTSSFWQILEFLYSFLHFQNHYKPHRFHLRYLDL